MHEGGDVFIRDNSPGNIFCKPFFNHAKKQGRGILIGDSITVVIIIKNGLFVAAAQNTNFCPGQRYIHIRMIGIGDHPLFRSARGEYNGSRISPVIIILVLVDRTTDGLCFHEVHLAVIHPADNIAVNVRCASRSLHGGYPFSAVDLTEGIGTYCAVGIRYVHLCFINILDADSITLYAKVAHRAVLSIKCPCIDEMARFISFFGKIVHIIRI